MSSTVEGKKSKRRKNNNKKSATSSSSSSSTSTTTITKDNGKNNNNCCSNDAAVRLNNNGLNEASSNGSQEENDETKTTMKNDHSMIVSEVEHLMMNCVDDDDDSPIPSSNVRLSSRSSNPYFSGSKCLVCQKDKTSEVGSNQVTNQDTCEHLEMFPLGHFSRLPLWICAECRCSIEDDHGQKTDFLTPPPPPPPLSTANDISIQETSSDLNLSFVVSERSSPEDTGASTDGLCECIACQERRELESEQEREALELHQSWTELREAIRNVYHGEGLVSLSKEKSQGNPPPSMENLEEVVHKLCVWDSHQFFLWLESYGRELVIEIKLNLLKYLGTGFNNSHQAKLFVTFMLEDYALLCSACKKLRPLIKELEQGHLKKFNLSWELVNRHLFQSMVYGDHQIQNALPGLITQLRLIRSDDENVQKQLTSLLKKYIQFNEEMMIIAVIWREAEPLIQEFSWDLATLKARRRICREDWEAINKLKRKLIMQQEPLKKSESSAVHRCRFENCNQKSKCSCTFYSASDSVPSSVSTVLPTQQNITGRHCNFSNDIPESLDGLIRDYKDHCLSSEIVENGRSEGLKSMLEDVWSRNLAPTKDCHGLQCHHEFGVGDYDRKQEHPLTMQEVPSRKSNNNNDNGGAFSSGSHVCGTGIYSCQYNVMNNLTPQISNSSCVTSVGNTNVTSVDLPTVDLPCECHACVQNADSATIPAIFNVLPPRPAALHLYPHIHGPNTGHNSLHNNSSSTPPSSSSSHSQKPFFHSHINGVHVPSVSPCFKFGSSNQDSTMTINGSSNTHSIVQEKSHVCHGYTDWDNPYKNGGSGSSKGTFNSRKNGDSISSSVHHHHHHHRHHHHKDFIDDGGDRNHLTQDDGILRDGSVVASIADLSQAVVKNDTNASHLNKTAQVLGSNVGYAQNQGAVSSALGHSTRDCHHSKQHSHGGGGVVSGSVFPHNHSSDGLGCCDMNNQSSMHNTFGAVSSSSSSSGKSSTSHQSCGVAAGSHVAQLCCGPASKRPCEGVLEPRNNLSSAQSQANSSSLCSSQDVENFTCDLEESVDDSCSEQSSSTSTSNQRDGKHCDCCYCEVFGHDVAAFAPMSRNYTEMRDKLRLRLNKKKMECMNEVNIGIAKKEEKNEDCRNLDDLINFINGGRDEGSDYGDGGDAEINYKLTASKTSKKAHKKQKKVDVKVRDEVTSDFKENLAKDDTTDVAEIVKSPVVIQQAHRVSVIREVPKVAAVVKSTVESATIVEKSKSKAPSIGKEALNQQTKCNEKAKLSESKDTKLPSQATERSSSIEPEKNSDCFHQKQQKNHHKVANNVWEMVNGTCHLLDKMSRKKRKSSTQPSFTPTSSSSSVVSSPNGSTASSGNNSNKESPSISRHTKVLQDVRVSNPRARSDSKETSVCSLAVTLNGGGGKTGKSHSSSSRMSPVRTVRCNGMENVDTKRFPTPTNTKPINNKAEVTSCNGSSDSSSKNRTRKEERRKSESSQPQLVSNPSIDHSFKNGGVSTTKMNGNVATFVMTNENSSSKNSIKVKRNKKKVEKSNTIDDVFVPRDIDLDNIELDETERELEAFKRFCWNSVPVANKEKIHVNLKDIVVRKKTLFEF